MVSLGHNKLTFTVEPFYTDQEILAKTHDKLPHFVGMVFYKLCLFYPLVKGHLSLRPESIDLARNGNSGCGNQILGCAKCHFR